MSLRRTFAAVCAVALGSAAILTPVDGWGRGSSAPQSQAPLWSGGNAVTKDGSQMTVVGGNLDRDIPIVDLANNSKLKKKPAPSFWSRLVHPSQWFSGSKSKK